MIKGKNRAVNDLRDAIALAEENNELVRIKKPVNVELELAGEYLKYAGGVPIPPPTKIGPVVLFENVFRLINSQKIQYKIPVIAGVLGSRERVAQYLGVNRENLSLKMLEAIENPMPLRYVSDAPCQEVVIDKNINLLEQLPIPVLSYDCAGPSITMGLMRALDPETGHGDVTFHRIIVVGPDTLTAFMSPIRHIKQMQLKAEKKNKPFPVSINIGLDPFTAISAGLSPPTGTDIDELTVAGALKGSPIEVVKCKTIDCEAIANAEIVIEAEVQPNVMLMEDLITKKGWTIPEMAGYMGRAVPAQVLKVKAITHREDAIYQTLINPGEEHNIIAGIPGEAEITNAIWRAGYKDLLKNIYLPPAGGGKLMCVIQVKKRDSGDDMEVRNIAMIALATRLEIRCAIIVDEDVEIYDPMDLWWALTTRFNAKEGLVILDQIKSWPGLAEYVRDNKMILDCTLPWSEKEKYFRPRFKRG